MTNRLKTLLTVDDDEGMRDTLTAILKRDYRALAVASAEAALQVLKNEPVDLMLLDVRLPGMNGIDMLKLVKEQHPMVEVIVISAVTEVETAVQAMKLGAYHYVTKDFEYDALRSLVRNASVKQDLSRQVATLSAQVADQEAREFVEGPSGGTRAVLELVRKVARLSSTVLFLGESGTGKELLARMVHGESAQRDGPFIAVNLAAIPHDLVESALFGHERGAFTGAVRQQLGKFELAAGGTLFLDEIGDLRQELQTKLLRAIQEAEIERVGGTKPLRTDFRLICATNIDLERAMKEGRFREDLYYRINVVPVRVPPLRERLDDLPVLTEFFVKRYATKFRKDVKGFTGAAVAVLQNHHWPGNIRELENLVERLVAVSEQPWIDVEDLPLDYRFATLEAEVRGGSLIEHALDAFERSFILRSLERSQGNVTATARYLGIPLSTLKGKMSRLEIAGVARRFRQTDER